MFLSPIVLKCCVLDRLLELTRIPGHKIEPLFHNPSEPSHLLNVTADVDTLT